MSTRLSSPLAPVQALRARGGTRARCIDEAVVECPVALLYNGQSHAVMMATPHDLADFALGFALAEGIVASASEFALVDTVVHDGGIALHAAIPQARFDALQSRRRALAGRSGCGLCGVESLDAALRPVPSVTPARPTDAAAIHAAVRALDGAQPLNARSGGVHAAAFMHDGGLLVREDVGRHNALDKLVGAMAGASLDPHAGFAVITSRASYEMVHKAATAGIALLVAMSAPTDLAVRTALDAGVTLLGFARDGGFNVYAHAGALRG